MFLKRNPFICLLVTALLIMGLAGQGAAAFKMACEGTAACCCRSSAAMPGMPADMTPMGRGCCDTPEPQPCDLAGPFSSPADPFLPTINPFTAEFSAALADTAPAAIETTDGGASTRIPFRPPSLAGPPVYLLTQTFLY
jgi:hypothetical protein